MKLLFTTIFFFGLTLSGLGQTQTLALYKTSPYPSDTSFYLTIQKDHTGISFVFPVQEGDTYYTYKKDSTLEEDHFRSTQAIYGPYKFKKVKGKILFQDKNISPDYRDLYELTTKEHFSPDLFSSSTDSYNISNVLLDSNALLPIGNITIPCFKFFQILSGHNSFLDKYYRIVYVDKVNLLPCTIEYYKDKDCKQLTQLVFVKSYKIL